MYICVCITLPEYSADSTHFPNWKERKREMQDDNKSKKMRLLVTSAWRRVATLATERGGNPSSWPIGEQDFILGTLLPSSGETSKWCKNREPLPLQHA